VASTDAPISRVFCQEMALQAGRPPYGGTDQGLTTRFMLCPLLQAYFIKPSHVCYMSYQSTTSE